MAYYQRRNNVKPIVRDFSEPLQTQRETTSYGERMMYVTSFEPNNVPLTYDLAKLENEMIYQWRNMAINPYIAFAIDDIINEMLASDDENVFPVDLDLSNMKVSESIKNKIHEEFLEVQRLLQFSKKAYSQIQDWYIDGRAYYYVDFKGKGIIEIKQMDPVRTKLVKNEKNEDVFIYQDIDLTNTLMELSPKNVIEINSGLMDNKHQIWISYLNNAYIPLNQVTSIEDAMVIYRIARAPERRVFYVDVGDLPKTKAEQYMREIINNFRNKMEFDSETGTIKDKARHMSLLDDIWLPRRNGTSTEVTTLQGGNNLDKTEDLDYFMKKLFRALRVPISRFTADDQASNVLGRATQITRDEVKYTKFIARLRAQYDTLFYKLLRLQLELKNIMKGDELDEQRENIVFMWNADNMFAEFKKLDMLSERMNVVDRYISHVGSLVSKTWVRKHIMRQTDEDIREMDKEMDTEEKNDDQLTDMDYLPVGGSGVMRDNNSWSGSGPVSQPNKDSETAKIASGKENKTPENINKNKDDDK